MQQLVTGMATMCARNTVSPIARGARICKQHHHAVSHCWRAA